MKKITESQLKDKVNSLREYLKVYENQQVDEWSLLSPSSWFNGRDYGDSTSRDEVRTQDATKASTGGANLALVQNREQLAPGSVASEQGKDGVTYAVDAKGMRTFKIENNKWVAMNPPTPTEQPELAGVPDANQSASVTPDAPSTQDLTAAASASGEAVGKSLQRFKELLAKAKTPAAAASAAAPTVQSPYALQANGAKLKANEGTDYFLNKLRLLESQQLNEALTPEEQKELDTLAQSFGDSEDPEIAGLLQQYSDVKNAAQSAAPAQAASVTPAAPEAPAPAPEAPAPAPASSGPITWKQIYDLNKDVIGKNPNLIKPNQVFKMPNGLPDYTVKAGDNLSKIAKNAGGGQSAKTTPVVPATSTNGITTQTGPAVDKEIANLRAANPNGAGRDPNGAYRGDRSDATVMDPKQPGFDFKKASAAANAQNQQVAKESVGYNELQRIVSLVNHR